ncbi:LGFP repeat-containing protein [Rhodococcus sp. YH1]|uniref:LGFP repeat-containing protein n=1 Tax=Rhodococcus sp. YH1 TaxID=89066 RepID=UPI0030842C82
MAPLPAELRPAPPAADQPVPPDDPARSSKTAEPDPDWHPTENPKSTLVPGQMRSDREEVPAPFTKEDADKAEIAEAGLRSSRSLTASSCQVYWPSWFQVCGAIRDKYNSLGGPASFLSYPTSGNIVNPGGTGERVTFANGPIYWSAATGAHPVVNSFLNRWGIHGYEAGWLKYPTTDEVVLPDGGRRQEFQEGAIYVAFQNAIGSAIRNGPLRDKYNSVGGLAPGGTLLGYPIQDQIGLPDGQGQMDRFERGVIYWHPAHGAHPISGPLLTQWERAGYEQGTYGYPISDQVSHPNIAVEQQFQNGRIYSPGLQLPLGTTGLSLYFGVPSAAPLQPAALSNGIVLHGDGLDVKFRPMESNAVEIGLDITTAQASSTFKLALALPSGYTLQSGSGRVNLLSPTGVVLGAVGHPIAVDAGGQLVNVQVSASGAEITYQFAPFTAFPIQSVSDSVTEAPGKIADQVQRWWGTGIQQRQVCEANPVDCMRAKPYVDVSIKQAKEAFPERNGEEDNRTDAARHCMWMGYSTERANADFARQMGTAHELDVPGSEEAGMMDRYNNKTGIDVGLRNEDNPDGIHTTCVQYAREARIVPDPRTIDLSNPNTNDLIALRHP